MNQNQATFTIPVFCKDQASDIRNIEATANKALQNIHALYAEIMTPKASSFEECEASFNDISSDAASDSISDRNDSPFRCSVPISSNKSLCRKCQKIVLLSSAYPKHKSNCICSNNHNSQTINKTLLPEQTNSYPPPKPLRRYSSYHPKRKDSNQRELHSQINTFQDRRDSCHLGNSSQKLLQCLEGQRNMHYPDDVEENSHSAEEHQRNAQQKQKLSISNSVHKNENSDRDFYKQERKTSYYPESSIVSNSELNDFPSYTLKSRNESKFQFKVTVPQPFSLTAENIKRQLAKEEKISKLKEEINNEIQKELIVKFSPKPIPKHVHLPLYDEMSKMNEKRKKERKEKCVEIINKKAKPFNLSSSAHSCTSKSASEPSPNKSMLFKAKPVPKNILSENISQKIKNNEEVRKLLIAQRAEEMLRKSSLPFSPKPIYCSLSLINISGSASKSNVKVTKEKIEAITNRLYSIKCQEAIENWNEKVLQNDLWNVNSEGNHRKTTKDKNVHKNEFSFQNYPVRMTTTTFLREKQIRADIEMRKRRGETNERILAETAQKRKEILRSIWPRLKSAEQMFDIGKEIEEKVKSYRESQKNREQEYLKELEDIMKRVSKQFLLIERQSKELKDKIADSNRNVEEEYSSKDVSDSSENIASSVQSNSPTKTASEISDTT